VEQYVWASSPLRRYVDLVNQRQIAALAIGETPPYAEKDERLLAVMREFESAYDVYNEFQRQMERYWCLRWLLQENVTTVVATVLRENLVRFDELPLVARVPSVPQVRSGAQVVLEISKIDLLDLSFHAEFQRIFEPAAAIAEVNASA
jgi:exoribonuclease-2